MNARERFQLSWSFEAFAKEWVIVFGVMLKNSNVLHWNISAILNIAMASHFMSLMLLTLLNMPVNCILDCLATSLCYLRTENVSAAWSALSMVNVILCECSQMFESKSIGFHCSFFLQDI